MNVVVGSADLVGRTTTGAANGGQIGKQFLLNFGANQAVRGSWC